MTEDGGGEFVAGLVDEGAGEVLAFADDDASVEGGAHGGPVGSGCGGEGEGVDAEVFAFAAVGVGVEVADEGAFGGGAAGFSWGKTFGLGKREDELADGAGLGVSDGGSGGVADGMDGGLGFLAETDDEEAFGLESGGGVEEEGFIGAGFEFAGGEDGGGGGADGFITGEQDGLGLGLGALGGLSVDGGDGEEFGFDLGEVREGKVCAHTGSLFHLEGKRNQTELFRQFGAVRRHDIPAGICQRSEWPTRRAGTRIFAWPIREDANLLRYALALPHSILHQRLPVVVACSHFCAHGADPAEGKLGESCRAKGPIAAGGKGEWSCRQRSQALGSEGQLCVS